MRTYRFIVSGKVQGVWYRDTIKRKAKELGVTGYVKNLPDKTVEVVANLSDEDYDKFLEILKEGSLLSRVENIEA
ncbi:MAG: acylphosphatase, partial [Epsilonproteobacteria bacterium]|nr:acylphosphatase [Campylobacterota bacterium]